MKSSLLRRVLPPLALLVGIGGIAALALVSVSHVRDLDRQATESSRVARLVGTAEKVDEVATQLDNVVEKLEISEAPLGEDRTDEPEDLRSDIASVRERIARVDVLGSRVEALLARAEVLAGRAQAGEEIARDARPLARELRGVAEELVNFAGGHDVAALASARVASVELHGAMRSARAVGLAQLGPVPPALSQQLELRIATWNSRMNHVRALLDSTAVDEDAELLRWEPAPATLLAPQTKPATRDHAEWIESTGDNLDDLSHLVEEIDDHIGDAADRDAESHLHSAQRLQRVLGAGVLLLLGAAAFAGYEWRRRRTAERELHRLATYDSLTGLLNRSGLEPRYAAMRRADDAPMAVLFLDLNDFKQINDEHGHVVGDEVLRQTAVRILREVRTNDLVFRIGGDEILILAPACDLVAAQELAERLTSAIAEPVRVGGRVLNPSASVGVKVVSDNDEPLETALHEADAQLYTAKSQHKAPHTR